VPLTSRTIDVNGRNVEVLEGGAGQPLVFLHGGSMIGGAGFLEPLTGRFGVFAPFLPGYGRTDLDPPVEGRDAVVEHLADVLDALGLDRVELVGHSLGGWRAVWFAARHPERVTRLVLGAPLGQQVPGHPITNMLEITPAERHDVLTYDEDIKASWLPTGPDPAFAAARELEQRSMARFGPGPFDPALSEAVAAVKAPALLLWGEEDRLIPVAHARAWADALPQARLVTYPGAGHLVFHERPGAVAEIIADADSEGA
jgi:pimeloyl-ACP methyl ester carboxylesterase